MKKSKVVQHFFSYKKVFFSIFPILHYKYNFICRSFGLWAPSMMVTYKFLFFLFDDWAAKNLRNCSSSLQGVNSTYLIPKILKWKPSNIWSQRNKYISVKSF